jgi:hypothetical protein
MAYIKRNGSTLKQMAYARQLFGGQGTSKKQIALNSGYSSAVANSIKSHIENKPGFNNAMSALAIDSNNLALAAMHEFKARGFEDFSNKDLVGALNAIGSAWAKFNSQVPKDDIGDKLGTNKLRNVVLQQIENQTFVQGDGKAPQEVKESQVVDVGPNLDF